MGANTKKCPNCQDYMNVGKLRGFDVTKNVFNTYVSIEEKNNPNVTFGISALYCKTCGHVELVLD